MRTSRRCSQCHTKNTSPGTGAAFSAILWQSLRRLSVEKQDHLMHKCHVLLFQVQQAWKPIEARNRAIEVAQLQMYCSQNATSPVSVPCCFYSFSVHFCKNFYKCSFFIFQVFLVRNFFSAWYVYLLNSACVHVCILPWRVFCHFRTSSFPHIVRTSSSKW